MELNKCSRCGSFYVSNNNVCPKCMGKENFELNTFKNYIEENGLNNSIDMIASETGISPKNLNRFLSLNDFKGYNTENGNNIGNNGITLN